MWDGKTYLEMKPNYKKMIVIVLAVIVLIAVIESQNAESKNNNGMTTQTNTSTENKKKETNPTVEGIKEKVNTEKLRIRNKFTDLEKEHLQYWNLMLEGMQNSDIYQTYEYAEKTKISLQKAQKEIKNINCNSTGDNEFDKDCKDVLSIAENAYLSKQVATEKLMKWLEDSSSPKKATETKRAMEGAGNDWQVFLLKLVGLTITDEEIQEAGKDNQNK